MSTIARLTLDEYYRMVDAAVFDADRRIELIHGELRETSPIGDRHRDAVNALTNDWAMAQSTAELRARVTVQMQSPIRLPSQQSAHNPTCRGLRGDRQEPRSAARTKPFL